MSSDFLQYLVGLDYENGLSNGDDQGRLPSLSNLSKELEISIASLREQLEVAEALGLVEVRPRTGIRRLPYSFFPAVRESLMYAIALDRRYFDAFADLRNHIESAYWFQATRRLTGEDHKELQALTDRAWEKLRGNPIEIPHGEHRQLHLLIFKRLENPFVLGLLEAYWEAYEAAGLNVYADYNYLEEVWTYHQKLVNAIRSGDLEAGYQALEAHKDLIYHRPDSGAEINKKSPK